MTDDGPPLTAAGFSASAATLAQAITRVLGSPADADALPNEATGLRVGLMGPPGVGKSSLLRELARELRRRDERVAVLASDPVSPKTGGAYLGDRVRFAELAEDPDVFVRSIGHRDGPGRPTRGVDAAARVLHAAGYGWVFFETVGIGQTETAVLGDVDVRVLVLSADSGDGQQMLKAGYLETADVYVVSKSDRPTAAVWARELSEIVGDPAEGAPAVFCASGRTGAGVPELIDHLRDRVAGG